MYILSRKSLARLEGVSRNLREIVTQAIEICEIDFSVLEGRRSANRQFNLWKAKKSKLNGIPKGEKGNFGVLGNGKSAHQIGLGVDLGAYVGSRISWEWEHYYPIAKAMRERAINNGTVITWGGVWDVPLNDLSDDLKEERSKYISRIRASGRSPFTDGPHFQENPYA